MDEDKHNQRKTEPSEEVDEMNATIDKQEYRRLDFSKIKLSKVNNSIEESLKDIVPIDWNNDIVQGKKQVIIKNTYDK